jgi:ADP-heptose:LPS heptosyltransferase
MHANGWAGIVRFGGIGDCLIAGSPAALLQRRGLRVEMISTEPSWKVYLHNPHIDKLSVKAKAEPCDRADEYEVFANLNGSIEGLLAFKPSQAQFNYPAEVRRRLADRSYLEMTHDIAGVPHIFGPLFHPSEREREEAESTKREIAEACVGWCLMGSRIDKAHPASHLILARLLRELELPVVMFGSPRDKEIAAMMRERVEASGTGTRHLYAAMGEEWTIRKSLSFAQRCDLMIGVDTGAMWAVAMESLPKIVLLGHASPTNVTRHWVNATTLSADPSRVPCWPCHCLHDNPRTCRPNSEEDGAACISDISAEEVVLAAGRALGGDGPRPSIEASLGGLPRTELGGHLAP